MEVLFVWMVYVARSTKRGLSESWQLTKSSPREILRAKDGRYLCRFKHIFGGKQGKLMYLSLTNASAVLLRRWAFLFIRQQSLFSPC